VALGGEVEHGARLVRSQQLRHQLGVVDVALDENVPCIAAQAVEVAQIAGVGELVEVDDGLVLLCQPLQHEVGADEARSAGNQDQFMLRAIEQPAL